MVHRFYCTVADKETQQSEDPTMATDHLDDAALDRRLKLAQLQDLARAEEVRARREAREEALNKAELRNAEKQAEASELQARQAHVSVFLSEVPPFDDDVLGLTRWLAHVDKAMQRNPQFADTSFAVLRTRLLGRKGQTAWEHAAQDQQPWQSLKEYLAEDLLLRDRSHANRRLRSQIEDRSRYKTIAPIDWASTLRQDRLDLQGDPLLDRYFIWAMQAALPEEMVGHFISAESLEGWLRLLGDIISWEATNEGGEDWWCRTADGDIARSASPPAPQQSPPAPQQQSGHSRSAQRRQRDRARRTEQA